MIDYFAGPLGKLKNIGSSKIYTTPHTVKIDPEYSITLPDEVQGELIAQSRDGRLWFYLDDTTLHIVALKWNQETARMMRLSLLAVLTGFLLTIISSRSLTMSRIFSAPTFLTLIFQILSYILYYV